MLHANANDESYLRSFSFFHFSVNIIDKTELAHLLGCSHGCLLFQSSENDIRFLNIADDACEDESRRQKTDLIVTKAERNSILWAGKEKKKKKKEKKKKKKKKKKKQKKIT